MANTDIYSVFPGGIDYFPIKTDVDHTIIADVRRYQELKQKTSLSDVEQAELSQLTVKLKDNIWFAEDLNAVSGGLTNLQVFFRDNTVVKLNEFKQDLSTSAAGYQRQLDTSAATYQERLDTSAQTYQRQLDTSAATYQQELDTTVVECETRIEATTTNSEHAIVEFANNYQTLTQLKFQSWTTTSSKDYDIHNGNESLDAELEIAVDAPANIEIVINGVQVSYDKYTIVSNSSGKKTIIRFSSSFTMQPGVRLEARWQDTSGKVFSVASHTHNKSDVTDLPQVATTGNYADLLGIPSSFPPSSHSHAWSGITGKPSSFTPSAHNQDWDTITGIPSSFPPSSHSQGWDTITGKPSSYTPSAHIHDDRYYTESEVNSKLAGKSDTSHSHDSRYYTEGEIDSKLAGKASSSHRHNISDVNGLQDEINGLKSSVSNGKTSIASAITGKGVPASGSDSFSTLSTKVGQIASINYDTIAAGTGANKGTETTLKIYNQTLSYTSSTSITISDAVFIVEGYNNAKATLSTSGHVVAGKICESREDFRKVGSGHMVDGNTDDTVMIINPECKPVRLSISCSGSYAQIKVYKII